jgi:hypothetical protein
LTLQHIGPWWSKKFFLTHQIIRRLHLDKQSRLQRRASFIPAVFWGAIVGFVSLTPGATIKKVGLFGIRHVDKLGHLTFYFILAVLLMHGLKKGTQLNASKAFVWSTLICCIFGLFLEFLQWEMGSGRRFEVTDIIANIIGALLGCAVFNKLLKARFYGS